MTTAERLLGYIKTRQHEKAVEWFIDNRLSEGGAEEVCTDVFKEIIRTGSSDLHLRLFFLMLRGLQALEVDEFEVADEDIPDTFH